MSAALWAVIPAAGRGSRMATEVPKQYLILAGETLLGRSVSCLLAAAPLQALVVAVAEDDHHWQSLPVLQNDRVRVVTGGDERADSVLAGLRALRQSAADEDWVIVHDAARPCVSRAAIAAMLEALADHPVGGIMATPVADTLKLADADRQVARTLDRNAVWAAQTPQVFRYGLLLQALESAKAAGLAVTDEASALELAGYSPQLFAGSSLNIKITRPEDLELAALILQVQGHE